MVPCRRRTLTQYSAFFIRSLSKLSIAVHTILVICRAANCIYMMVIERLAATNKIHFLQKMSEHFFLFFKKSSNLIYSRIFAPSFFFKFVTVQINHMLLLSHLRVDAKFVVCIYSQWVILLYPKFVMMLLIYRF